MSLDVNQLLESESFISLVKRTQAESSLKKFVEYGWDALHPDVEFQDNPHIDFLCYKLEQFAYVFLDKKKMKYTPEQWERANSNRKHKIQINVPPRSMKTQLFSVFFPAWLLLHKSNLKLATISYSEDLSTDLNEERRTLIKSNWFQSNWGHRATISKNSDNKKEYRTTQGARFFATSVKGGITGKGFDIIIGDDLQKPMDMYSATKRKEAVNLYTGTLPSRYDNPKEAYFIHIQQRVHYDDLSGYIERNEKDLYEIIKLPLVAREVESWYNPFTEELVFFREVGDLLWPSRWGEEEVEGHKRNRDTYNTQYQQNPLKPDGEGINFDNFQFYDKGDIPDHFKWYMAVDANNKVIESSDPVGIVVGATDGINTFIVEIDNQARGIERAMSKIKVLKRKYPMIGNILIETKANGPAIIQLMSKEIPGIVPIDPFGNKKQRLESAKTFITSHNIHIPSYEDPSWLMDNWVHEFFTELRDFPMGEHDDMVDAFSMLVNYIYFQEEQMESKIKKPKKFVTQVI